MVAASKAPSTIRNAYFVVHQVLKQAYVDGLIPINPAQRGYVKLPTNHSTGRRATVDDPSQFLTAAQVDALVAATPWPYSVMVHIAVWAGLRAAELCGLQEGDVLLPEPSLNPNAPTRPGILRVDRTVQSINGELTYVTPKNRGEPSQHSVDDPECRASPRISGRAPALGGADRTLVPERAPDRPEARGRTRGATDYESAATAAGNRTRQSHEGASAGHRPGRVVSVGCGEPTRSRLVAAPSAPHLL